MGKFKCENQVGFQCKFSDQLLNQDEGSHRLSSFFGVTCITTICLGAQDGTFGTYDAFYFMEFDAVPVGYAVDLSGVANILDP